jgi:quinolinate synthase
MGVEAKIIFPISSEAVTTSDFKPEVYSQRPIVQRVASGEGCSTASGCATCPFMNMNTLDAL